MENQIMSNRQIEMGKLILFPKGHQFAGEVGVVVNTVFEEEQIDVYVHSENRIICYDSEEYQDFIFVNGQLSCIFSDALPSSSPFRIEAIFRFKDEAPEEGKKIIVYDGENDYRIETAIYSYDNYGNLYWNYQSSDKDDFPFWGYLSLYK